MIRVFIIAGEPSGDKLGAAMMAGLKQLKDVEFHGIGGPLMQAEGMESLFPMDELSLFGIAEVLPKARHLFRRIDQTVEAVVEAKPDVLITIDSPDFCLRVTKRVKRKSNVRTVHYVAPSVWAWRPWRAKKMAKHIDHVLALLPFEPPYMEAEGMECDFVGHPVVAEPVPTPEQVSNFREKHGFGEAPILLVLPGSRRSEVTRLAPVFGEVLRPVLAARPELKLVSPTTSAAASILEEAAKDWPAKPLIISPNHMNSDVYHIEKMCAFYASDFALAASGTVSLELAAASTPMVIAYDANWLTRLIFKMMIRVDSATLVNLVSETKAVPEFHGEDCKPDLIAPAVLEMMDAPEAQLDAMRVTMDRLGRGGEPPGLRAAKAVLRRMGENV